MRYAAIVLAAAVLVGLLHGLAVAHGTAGLVKGPLKEPALLADHLAYYVEPFVMARRDEAGKSSRWYVWEFGPVEQRGDRAVLSFMVKDQKEGGLAEERMIFLRNPDGTWRHVDAAENVIAKTVFTYTKPFNMNRTIGYVFAAAAVLGYAALRLLGWWKKRRPAGVVS